jgi:phosphoglycerate dehydrogenase-like enzyme
MTRPRPSLAYCLDPNCAAEVFPRDLQERIAGLADPRNAPGRLGPGPWPDVEILLGGWGMVRLDEPVLASLPRLRHVLYAAGSIRYFMTEAAWERGLTVSTAAEQNGQSVAEFCVGAMLMSLKQVWRLSRALHQDRAVPAGRQQAPGVMGSTIGLVSFGRIARHVVHLLRSFPVQILVWDPIVPPADILAHGARPVGLEELFSRSDVVSVHTPLLPATRQLVDRRLLERLKPGATLINTSRGAIIDEAALIELLQARPDLMALLDVTDPEPPEPASPLYDLPNVVLTPHIAGCTGGERRRLGEAMVQELERLVTGQPLQGITTRAAAAAQA